MPARPKKRRLPRRMDWRLLVAGDKGHYLPSIRFPSEMTFARNVGDVMGHAK